jgi:hypothetical protein
MNLSLSMLTLLREILISQISVLWKFQQLTLLRTQRSALDRQKGGLMQRLLTGKLQVKA